MPSDPTPVGIFLHHQLLAPVTSISGLTQLLQRQVLRADGLTNLERDPVLGNLAAMRDAANSCATSWRP